jgi:hypothetical protein
LYPLGRKYTVGDAAPVRESHHLTNVEQRTYTQRITRVDAETDQVEINGGRAVWDLMGNVIKAGNNEFDAPRQFTPAEFQVGKKWTAAFIKTKNDLAASIYYDFQIVRREKIVVPAGSFDTFRIEGQGWNRTVGKHLQITCGWCGLNFFVGARNYSWRKGRSTDTERRARLRQRPSASIAGTAAQARSLALRISLVRLSAAFHSSPSASRRSRVRYAGWTGSEAIRSLT